MKILAEGLKYFVVAERESATEQKASSYNVTSINLIPEEANFATLARCLKKNVS